MIEGRGTVVDAHTVRVKDKEYTVSCQIDMPCVEHRTGNIMLDAMFTTVKSSYDIKV